MHRIGVFDSGIGGLTVLRQLRRAFPQLDMVYLGDTARVPYGGRSVETITHYAEDDVRFLLRKDVEAIVIACGTVSSNSLDALREKFDLPIYGVIESAARLAASMTKTRSVGVIGTQATVKSGAYETHIRAIDAGVHVVSRACPLFVPLVENGIAPDDIVAETVCSRYMESFAHHGLHALPRVPPGARKAAARRADDRCRRSARRSAAAPFRRKPRHRRGRILRYGAQRRL